MADLTNLTLVKSHGGGLGAGDDTLLAVIITAVSAAIEEEVNRVISEQSGLVHRAFHPGHTTTLVLPEWPVTTITSIVEDGATLVSADYLQLVTNGRTLTRMSGEITRQNWIGHTVTTFTAGYSTIPKDIEQLATKQVLHLFNESPAKGGHIGQVAVDNETNSVTFPPFTLLDAVVEGLDPHRRLV